MSDSSVTKIFISLTVIILAFTTAIYIASANSGGSPARVEMDTDREADSLLGVTPLETYELDSLEVYLIRLQDRPLASYRGGIVGLAATNPGMRGESKLDADSPESIAYRDYLLGRQAEFISRMESLLGREIDIRFQYYAANNGLAVYLTPEEVAQIEGLPEVKFMQRNFTRKLMTDVSPQWVGAPGIWDGTDTGGLPGTMGEGIIIGVIDTGINPSNPSFADVGGDGYDHSNPWGSGNYVGVCDSGDSSYDPTFPCNDKLIGARGYSSINGGDPRDTHSHGSHTASTAGGNQVTAHLEGNTTSADREISGIAPHANIVAYLACDLDGCPGDALSAAIDQIVIDGVDVVNYSIGSTAPSQPWEDFDSVGFLEARSAGIFVATSAGNEGPNPNTVGSPGDAPWLTAAAASSHNRRVTNALVDMSGGVTAPPADIPGVSFTTGYGPAEIVYAGDYGDALCLDSFTQGTFSGQIVICDRGQIARVDKGQHVLDGGAGGLILANSAAEGDALVSDDHYLPAVHITYDDGAALKAWVNDGGSSHEGTIRGTLWETNDAWGDIVANFSSRGANRALPGIIKPDITAPGEDVLAAMGIGDPSPAEWGFMGGTSMASPHIAGAGALLMSLHPDWTPAEIQSALMTTAWQDVLDTDGLNPADPFDYGSGRLNLSLAARAGLVLDETRANYDAADPGLGGDPSSLNLPSLGQGECWQTCSWTRTLESTLDSSMSWEVTVSAANGMDLVVSPSSFTIPAGGTQVITVEADVSMATPEAWAFGEVLLTPGDSAVPAAHLPVAAFASTSTNPRVIEKTADIDLVELGGTIGYTVRLTHKSMEQKSYQIVDPIPENSTYVSGSATGGLTYNSGTDTLSWSGTMPAGEFTISEEQRTLFISMGELGAPPVEIPSNADTGCYGVEFDFEYFGDTYVDGIWSVNGTLEAGQPFPALCSPNANGQVPSNSTPNNLMAPFWDDLDFTNGGEWYYVGVTWNNALHIVFSWENVPIKGTSNTATFQIWIEEGTDNIWFSYPAGGLPASPDATIGAENSNGSDGVTYYYNGTGTIPDGTADLVIGPEEVVNEFTFQVTADGFPSVVNELEMNAGGVTDTAFAFSRVCQTNTWLGDSSDWSSPGNWSQGSVPGINSSVVIPSDPPGGIMPVLSSDVELCNLELQAEASVDFVSHKASVEHNTEVNGKLIQTIENVPAGRTTAFLSLTNASGAQEKTYGVEITPTSGNMGSTTVSITANTECTVGGDPSDTVNRCFDITPTTAQTADIRFYYRASELDGQDPDDIQVWRWSGGSWVAAGTVTGRGQNPAGYHWVEVSGVSSYSPFTLSDEVGGPTVVALNRLVTRSTPGVVGGLVLLGALVLAGGLLLITRRRAS